MTSKEQTIPVVDLNDFLHGDQNARDAFIATFGQGLKELGFVAIENHGVNGDLIGQSYTLFKRFFALDETAKRAYEDPSTGRQRGYTPFRVEHAKNSDTPDLKEFWHLGRALSDDNARHARLPGNLWPSKEVPELEKVTLELFGAMESCATTLLQALAIYLGADTERLSRLADDGNSVMRVIHYPACEGFTHEGAMRAAAHEDINLITLLPEATDGGLEILTREGEWIPIEAISGQMIVDSGDMLKRLTNDIIPATTHRVVNPSDQTRSRYSMPFFVHPHPDALLEVLPECIGAGEQPKYAPVTTDAYFQERLRAIGLA